MPKATRQAFGEALAELAASRPQVVVLDADLSKSTMTSLFGKKFPDRRFQFGIAEANAIGAAAGLALSGKVPVVSSFACFLVGRLEAIRVCVAYNKTNVKLVGTHAGLGIGDDGASQMGLEDLGALRSLPNLTILQPADEAETRQMTAWMLDHEGPVYLRLTRQKTADVHRPEYRFRPGVSDTVYEPPPGAPLQATLFASGGTVGEAVKACEALRERGFRARAVNCGSIVPFDEESVERAARDSARLVTLEDHHVNGGLGSAVCEAAARRGLRVPVVRLGAEEFGESGTAEELYEKRGLSWTHAAEACLRNLT